MPTPVKIAIPRTLLTTNIVQTAYHDDSFSVPFREDAVHAPTGYSEAATTDQLYSKATHFQVGGGSIYVDHPTTTIDKTWILMRIYPVATISRSASLNVNPGATQTVNFTGVGELNSNRTIAVYSEDQYLSNNISAEFYRTGTDSFRGDFTNNSGSPFVGSVGFNITVMEHPNAVANSQPISRKHVYSGQQKEDGGRWSEIMQGFNTIHNKLVAAYPGYTFPYDGNVYFDYFYPEMYTEALQTNGTDLSVPLATDPHYNTFKTALDSVAAAKKLWNRSDHPTNPNQWGIDYGYFRHGIVNYCNVLTHGYIGNFHQFEDGRRFYRVIFTIEKWVMATEGQRKIAMFSWTRYTQEGTFRLETSLEGTRTRIKTVSPRPEGDLIQRDEVANQDWEAIFSDAFWQHLLANGVIYWDVMFGKLGDTLNGFQVSQRASVCGSSGSRVGTDLWAVSGSGLNSAVNYCLGDPSMPQPVAGTVALPLGGSVGWQGALAGAYLAYKCLERADTLQYAKFNYTIGVTTYNGYYGTDTPVNGSLGTPEVNRVKKPINLGQNNIITSGGYNKPVVMVGKNTSTGKKVFIVQIHNVAPYVEVEFEVDYESELWTFTVKGNGITALFES